jgi:hypothetical protein
MPDRYRSSAARDLAAAIRKAGGSVERTGKGKLHVTGPDGEITIQEPASESRRDLRRSSVAGKITVATGLVLTS